MADFTSRGVVSAIVCFAAHAVCLWQYVDGRAREFKRTTRGVLGGGGDGTVDVLRWMDEPSVLLPTTFTALYLSMVFFGPRIVDWLKPGKKGFELKSLMVTYNVYQTVFNVACVWLFVSEIVGQKFKIWGETCGWTDGKRTFKIALAVWLHYNNKYLELCDTLWMILRKKTSQMSFLHVYHHVLIIWAWWMVVWTMNRGPPCVDIYFGALCNSFIHVVMYSYYALAALGVAAPWKKYITRLQLLQFVVVFVHAIFCLLRTKCMKLLPYSQMFVMANMLVLFKDFYVKSYKTKSQKNAKKDT